MQKFSFSFPIISRFYMTKNILSKSISLILNPKLFPNKNKIK